MFWRLCVSKTCLHLLKNAGQGKKKNAPNPAEKSWPEMGLKAGK